MTVERKGGDLFIVDNSISEWTGLRYLRDWTEIAKSFDIATGYFEIGSLLALDGKWQQLEKIRILMGSETTHRTKKMLLKAIKERSQDALDRSLESAKEKNPFLNGVAAIEAALESGQIECRVYSKDKFHAKAYITHAKLEVVGSQALVGSSNFTEPGLTQNIELNIKVESSREVAQLQGWFDEHWEQAEEVTDDIRELVNRHVRAYSPFDVYTKALQEFFRGHEMTASEWEESESKLFPQLDRYQQEAYWALMKIAHTHRGAFLCDGVGLGKTFVGLMLIERLIVHENRNVVLFAPKGAKEGVWEPHLKKWLPHIGGIGGGVDFSNLAVFSHTDLNRTANDFPERFKRIANQIDVVIIDEAHHFRNTGKAGDPETGEGRSRYYKLFDLLEGDGRPKMLFMLTATPINNSLADFRHMAELFTRGHEDYFARTIGINNLRAHFNQMERALRTLVRTGAATDATTIDAPEELVDVDDHLEEARRILANDEIFRRLVVQRSRAYAKESQIREKGTSAAVFPENKIPAVAAYSIHQTYGRLLEIFEKAFSKKRPLFDLPMYYPLAYYKGDMSTIDDFDRGRQRQVVTLIRTQFLKRFESSVRAFELSCDRLLRKLLAFLEVHSETEGEKKALDRWKYQNEEILKYLNVLGYVEPNQPSLGLGASNEDDDEDQVDVFLQDTSVYEGKFRDQELTRENYRIEDMMRESFLDMDEIVKFLVETKKIEPKNDDKLKKLVRLLRTKDLKDEKVLIFTEFAETARYISAELIKNGIEGVEQIDSGTKGNRAAVIRRFAPYYNGSTSQELEEEGVKEIRVLISTDVLSEGLNLQDACKMMNYDIHWNPVRLMQRIGRVDRRMDPEVESQMIKDHPERASSRGKIRYWNFLPPEELNTILSLYKTLTRKILLISKTQGIEGKKLLTPQDDLDALKDFNASYEGTRTATEDMHLEYQSLIQEHPDLEDRLRALPGAIFSGRKRLSKGARGVFFCYGLSALDPEKQEFTYGAGTTRWYLYDADKEQILEDPGEIVESIRSNPKTPRKCTAEQETLISIREKVRDQIKNTYEKPLNAPMDAPAPSLKCWMELTES